MKKNLLVIGSGGREHALCWKLKQSPLLDRLWCAPGNAGISQSATCVELPTPADIIRFCKEKSVDLVVIGPEQPLVEGLADGLRQVGIAVFGPSQQAAQLEGSKAFTKRLCQKYGIPTADYGTFTDPASALRYLEGKTYPQVIKADGLAAGKGVMIAQNAQEAEKAITEIFSGTFGAAGATVVIEEFLDGEEVSFFALCDGKNVVEFGAAQDHKRAFDGDTGPNTGGMGTYAPPPVFTESLREQTMQRIILPTVSAMIKEGFPFQGVLFAGLMITKQGVKLLEYNARFGDPETQTLMLRLEDDLLPLLDACAKGRLAGMPTPRMKSEAAVCVVMATSGYPGAYVKGSTISGIAEAEAAGAVVFHAGTALKDKDIIATGGRVLGVSALGTTIAKARESAYRAVDTIDWPEGFCRRDIGWRAMQ